MDIEAGIEASLAEDIAALSGRALGERLRRNRRWADFIEADFARTLARFDQVRGFEADGAVDSVAWLKTNGRLTAGAAAERVHLAQRLDLLAATHEKLASGEIGFGHATVIARAVDDVSPEAVTEMEAVALEKAETSGPSELRQFTRRARAIMDPAGLLTTVERAHALRRLSLSEDRDGMFVLDGLLDPESGLTVRNALESFLGPPARDDERSAVQRRHDALVELARRHLAEADGVGGTGCQRPQLMLTVTAEAVRAQPGAEPGMLDGLFPVPAGTVRRIACDSAVTPMLVDERGHDMDLGRSVRTVPPPMRRAVVARDKICRFPDCDRPADWCEAHHIKHWADGGETKKENLVLVCIRHHRLLHEGGWRLELRGTGDLVAIPP